MEIAKNRPRVKLESEQNDNIHPTPTKGSDVSQMTERHSHSLTIDTSFTDNLMQLYEGCRDEMFELKKQNKLRKQEISQLKIETSKWKTIAECYITSWDSVQPEFKDLRTQIDSAEMREAELKGEIKLMEMEREKERKNMEEREKEVCAQRRKMDLMEKERREMEMKLNQLQKIQTELKTVSEKQEVDRRMVSEMKGQSQVLRPVQKAQGDHIPRVCGSLVGSSVEPATHQKLRRALKSKALPSSALHFHQSTNTYLLPSPPKSSGLLKSTTRSRVKNLIPLQII